MRTFRVHGTIEFKDFLSWHKLAAARRRLWVRSIIGILGFGVLVYAVLLVESRPDWFLIFFGGFVFLYPFLFSPIQFWYRVERVWQKVTESDKVIDTLISEDGVTVRVIDGSSVHLGWERICKYREHQTIILLYYSVRAAHPVPKRFILEGKVDDLRELIESKVGKS